MYSQKDVVDTFLGYFQARGHTVIPGHKLVPHGKGPELFINSGVHGLKSYITGEMEPPASRLTSVQRCVRTIDIDKVGNADTLTFFHMLGSWSIGNYWKQEAIQLAYDLLTDGFDIPHDKLAVTVFGGGVEGIEADSESVVAWKELGFDNGHLFLMSGEDNLWSMGPSGPRGPCTEIFFDRGASYGEKAVPGDDSGRYVEIWNAGVFMEYDLGDDGVLRPMKPKVVDTGAGLERLVATLNNDPSVYYVSPLSDIMASIVEHANMDHKDSIIYARIIADHVRTATHLVNEGIMPQNKMQGYVLRRLLRKAIFNAKRLEIPQPQVVLDEAVRAVGKELDFKNLELVLKVIDKEDATFERTLQKGQKQLMKTIDELTDQHETVIPGAEAHRIFETYGFPVELTQDIAREHGLTVDKAEYELARQEHQQASRDAAKSN